jgi:hypothetical protein
MTTLKGRALAIVAGLALLSTASARADLLEYTFKGADGNEHTLQPEVAYANPVGPIKFPLSAGIDRKVRLSILKPDGSMVFSQKSHLLGASDRITVGGKTYYGAEITATAPPEGTYQLKAEILSSNDQPVQTDVYHVVIDTTPPTASGAISWKHAGHAFGSIEVFTNGYSGKEIYLTGISDAHSGISSAQYFAIGPDGVRREADASLNEQEGTVTIPVTTAAGGALAPDNQAEYRIGFSVTDRAGNTRDISRTSKIDRITPSYITEVFDSSDGAWKEYSSGMTVYDNPVKIRFRRKKSDHVDFNGSDYGWADSKYNEVDAEYANYVIELPYPQEYSYFEFSTKAGRYTAVRYSAFNFTLAGGASLGPNPGRLQYHLKDEGWVDSERPRYAHPYVVDQVRLSAEERPYDQKTWLSGFPACVIPAGATSCVADVNVARESGRGYSPIPYYISKTDDSFRIHGGYLYTYWDMNPPEIAELSVREVDGAVAMRVVDNDRMNNWQINHWDTREFKAFAVANGDRRELPRTSHIDADYKTKLIEFGLNALPDGQYQIIGEAIDTYGNSIAKTYDGLITVDNTPPALNVTIPEPLQTLDNILIGVSDTLDAAPKIKAIRLHGGPASDDVQLSWREEARGQFRLEYPIMFPSLAAGEEYTLSVIASDAQGNETTQTKTFAYSPRQVSLANGMNGRLQIPAVTQEIVRSNGGKIIQTEPLTLSDGSLVSGSYDVYATLRSDAEVPMVVNGIRIEPGQTMSVMSQHDFGSSGGRIDLALRPAVADVEGSSNLLVMTSAPNSPVLVVDVNTWIGKAKLSADSWEVRQVIDPVSISASPEVGVACRLTSDEAAARAADPIRDPVCLLEWEQTPDEAEPIGSQVGGLELKTLRGQAVALGEQPVSYSLYLFSGDGRKIRVGGGEQALTVVSAFGAVGYWPMGDVQEVYRVIQEFDVRMRQSKGPACSLTLDAMRAQTAAENRSLGQASSTCLFEWVEIPDGMQQDPYVEAPSLFGSLREKRKHTLRWRVSIFTKSGTRVTLATERFDIDALDPPAPTTRVMSQYHYEDDIYMVPMEGGYLGDAIIEGELTAIDVLLTRDGEALTNETFQPGRGAQHKIFRRLESRAKNLWDETVFNINAGYSLLPEVSVTQQVRAVAVPGYDIRPQIEVGVSEALDTAPLPVKVSMANRLHPEQTYSAESMGEWQIRLVREESFGEVVPMSEFVDAPSGEVQFNLDLTGIERSVRLVAQARLKSPIEGYERLEESQRMFMTVLRGGAIAAGVEGRRLAGAAPFSTILQLELENRADIAATGDVIWEVSADNGGTWESYRSSDRNRFRWYRTYEKGEYLVRAKVINANSGAESYTETIEVIAYQTPKVEIVGAETMFVGTEATYTAKVTKPDGTPMEGAIIKWTQDRGETFFHEGDTLKLSSDTPKRFSVEAWVRDGTAPDDDRYSYTRERAYADFRPVKGPRVYLTGPRVVETGKSYEYLARLSPPYKGMDVELEGFFILPNGETVSGETLTYSPTEDDLAAGGMELGYTGWVKGFRDQGTEASRDIRARVWEYVWPEFNLYMRSSASMAPADVTARVRMIAFRGQLDQPKFEWDIPQVEGFQVTESRWDDIRSFQITKPGTYTVKVTITDARGNSAVIEETLEVGEAPPYVVEINYSASNDYNRAPLELRMRPYVTGGHPRDRVVERVYAVDGQQVEGTGYSARATLQEGSHEVALTIRSLMGKEVTKTMTVDVARNQPPQCSVRVDDRYSAWTLYAECEDVDGDMDAFEWKVNGEPVSVRSNRLTLLKSSYNDALPRVELTGYDDAGSPSPSITAQ